MIYFFTLLLGFVPLIWGANMLVNGASSLANNYRVPRTVIGMTIVAFGTSSPELAVSVFASIDHHNYITVGNVIGSNIFNVAAVLGVAAIIYPLHVRSNTTWHEVPLSLLAGVVVLITANDVLLGPAEGSVLSRSDGLLMMLFFAVFLVYNISLLKKGRLEMDMAIKNLSSPKAWILVAMGVALLIGGGQLIVYSAGNFAEYLGITERIVALLMVSLGTSLPELTTSVVAARKKNVDLAVGNIVGSNIFNIFFVLGLSAIIHPLAIGQSINEDLIFNVFISLLLFVFIFTGKGRMIDRTEGSILLVLYLFYVCYILFMM